jgi:deaminated glutathione amidase
MTMNVLLLQHAAGRDVAANLAALDERLADAGPADLIALPEVFAVRGSDVDLRQAAEPLDGRQAMWLHETARRHKAWVLGGSILEREGRRIFNTTVLVDRTGKMAATYRKLHLFEATLDSGKVVRERDVYEPGEQPVMAEIEGWACGLSICYDVRFPELYRLYAKRGASLLFIPANFTQNTGKFHWETLVKARAIENQCFVVAPNQCGANPVTGVESYGHSLIVGPWGEVLAEGGTEATLLRATLDKGELDRVRARVPALKHRRILPES